jgi:serine/threonine-protein kinase
MSAFRPGPPRVVGRYTLFGEIASGGMATVHLGRLQATAGFSRTVAIKRMHPQFAKDPEFLSMALDEARLAARVQHPNVVSVHDVVALEGEMLLVMEYIAGEALSKLLRNARLAGEVGAPARIASAIVGGALHGLHAAHEARSERGVPLGIVHRDVSPQNILVGSDGVARVVDFGVAKAANRLQTTREGQVKGKLSYMSPEQLRQGAVDRRADIYAAAVVLWETLTGQRLYGAEDPGAVVTEILFGTVRPPSELAPDIPAALDEIVMRGLAPEPSRRFGTAREMALALEEQVAPATASQVGAWVEALAADSLRSRADLVAGVERVSLPLQSREAMDTAGPSSPSEDIPAVVAAGAAQLHSQVSSLSVSSSLGALGARRRVSLPGLMVGTALLLTAGAGWVMLASGPQAQGGRSGAEPGVWEPVASSASGVTPAEPVPSASAPPLSSLAPSASVRPRPKTPITAPTRRRVHDFGF